MRTLIGLISPNCPYVARRIQILEVGAWRARTHVCDLLCSSQRQRHQQPVQLEEPLSAGWSATKNMSKSCTLTPSTEKRDLIRSAFPVFASSHIILFAGCVFLNDFLIRCLKKLVCTQAIHQREPEGRSRVHLLCFLPPGHHHSDGGAGGAHQDTQSPHLRARQVLHAVRSPRHQEMEDGL